MKGKIYIKKGLTGFLMSAFLILLDQAAKVLAVRNLQGYEPRGLIPGVLELRYVENRGAAFGILENQKGLLIVFTSVVLALIVYAYLKKIPDEKRFIFFNVVAILLFSGAVGNFIDRLSRDYVVDFFNFMFIEFPVFNVADIYIVIGAFLLFTFGMFYYKDEDYEKIFPSEKKEKPKERKI